MPPSKSEILELREAYRGARAVIDQIPDRTERSIGLASVRLEAAQTLRHVITTSQNLADSDVAPLKEYVAHLDGGEDAEKAVELLEANAKKAPRTS